MQDDKPLNPDPEFASLIQDALSDDTKKSKEAIQKINKHKYQIDTSNAKQILDLIKIRQTFNQSQIYTLYRMVITAVIGSTGRDYYDQIVDFFYEGITSDDGRIRELSRKLIMNYSFFAPLDKADPRGYKAWDKVVAEIEKLISQYSPSQKPNNIEEAKPSIYKSLALTWYDATKVLLYHQRNDLEQAVIDLDLPPEYPDYNDLAYQFTKDKAIAQISAYYQEHDLTQTKELLKQIENRSKKDLKSVLKKLGKSEYYANLIKAAKAAVDGKISGEYLSSVLAEIVPEIYNLDPGEDEQNLDTIRKYNPILRSVMDLNDNLILAIPRSVPHSMQMVQPGFQEYNRSKPKRVDYNQFLQSIINIHDEIDAFYQEISTKWNNEVKEFEKQFGKSNIVKSYDFSELTQVVHFVLTYLIDVDYRMLLTKTPKQIVAILTAIIYSVPLSFNFRFAMISNQELAEYAGWKSTSSLPTGYDSLTQEVISNLPDPTLILISEQDS
ncbi:hypothetical protein H6792_03330 [Candidatus Nomurabacteria bacterium]|nr:hypothetical protein [Candidatus Nomurabacteria bacterium]